jgi:Leucine-rich repeat (LRR) protein
LKLTSFVRLFFAFLLVLDFLIVTTSSSNAKCWVVKVNNLKGLKCQFSNTPENFFFINYKKLESLFITNSTLQMLPSGVFTGLVSLKSLQLNDNDLEDLPVEVFKPLKSIQDINLSHNKLSNIDFDRFTYNSKLQTLSLGNNNIKTIGTIHNGSEISITVLWINDNQLVNISEICKLANLNTLSLSNNPNLNFDNLHFNCWDDLMVLILQNTNLKSLKNDYGLFAGLSKLEFLDLDSNELHLLCVTNFPEIPALKFLLINNNKFQTLNFTELKTKFQTLHTITLFENLWNCAIFENMSNLSLEIHKNYCTNRTVSVEFLEYYECKLTSHEDSIEYLKTVRVE